ncbi:protein kinase domain containing protein [Stylonychia lemnae]|uniref:Protein kinase domain containing protein n=1 Tax=Stylonychia lemnae TaxID=5949 RepID=A0A078BB14_STYLE|nr:protein kinase domain containing protein [Stylonychia lemnae]|eukprot:CDW90758.1 protein kinase domain containing protein [Stylonychia lemnae]
MLLLTTNSQIRLNLHILASKQISAAQSNKEHIESGQIGIESLFSCLKFQWETKQNGLNEKQTSRYSMIKVKSNVFKQEYFESLINSFESKYYLDNMLGQGMHATVFKCFKLDDIHKKEPFAVKIVRDDDDEKRQAHQNEFEIMHRLEHPNIVKGLEIFINNQKKEIHQVMKYIDGKEILDQITEIGAYSEKEALTIFKQVMAGIKYLHENGICHRDIKPSNILVTKEQQVYIADFNVARQKNGEIFRMMTKTGTLAHNIWSAGTVLYTLLSGQQAFDHENVSRLISKITLADFSFRDQVWLKISEQAKDLLNKMFTIDPSERPSAEQVLQHPWFSMNFDSHQQENELREVVLDLELRKSLKSYGKLSISQIICVGSIDEEILKKGLQISDLNFTKSLTSANVGKDAFFDQAIFDKNKRDFEDKLFDIFLGVSEDKNEITPEKDDFFSVCSNMAEGGFRQSKTASEKEVGLSIQSQNV